MDVYCSKICSCGEDIDAALESAMRAIRIDRQTLTEDQKAQARENIGAVTVADVLAAIPVAEGVGF